MKRLKWEILPIKRRFEGLFVSKLDIMVSHLAKVRSQFSGKRNTPLGKNSTLQKGLPIYIYFFFQNIVLKNHDFYEYIEFEVIFMKK